MAVEDRICKYVQQWMKEWEEDLDRRPDAMKDSISGACVCVCPGGCRDGWEKRYRMHWGYIYDKIRKW